VPRYSQPMSTQPVSSTNSGVPAGSPAASAPAPGPGGFKATITIDDFLKLDLRVARVLAAEPHPKADKLLKLKLDDGSGTPRQICAGIREHYTAEQMVGRSIIIVANLAPRELRGEVSQGMLLAASNAPKGDANVVRKVIVLRPDVDIEPGSIVS